MQSAVMEQINQGLKDTDAFAAAERLLFSARGKLVLVVEDHADARSFIGRTLESLGAQVDFAEDGREGAWKAMTGQYDVILMDIAMPICDGIEATRRLRDEGYEGWIAAVTAHPFYNGVETGYELGFDDYLLKPVTKIQLLHAIAFHSRHRRRRNPPVH